MFVISGRNLPYVGSYANAEAVWGKSYQHERFGENARGLVNMRDTSKRIVKDGDAYKFVYHRTAMVEWHPKELRVWTYDSRSSAVFSDAFLPHGMRAQNAGGEMYITYDGRWYRPEKDYLVFNLVDGKLVLDESTAAKMEVYVLDKKVAAHVRKKLKPFREHRDILLRLRNGEHRAELRSEGGMCEVLNNVLMYKALDAEAISILSNYTPAYDDDLLLPNAYLIGGAVKLEKVTGVTRDRYSPYSGRVGRHYL